jgi:hypothetical protein
MMTPAMPVPAGENGDSEALVEQQRAEDDGADRDQIDERRRARGADALHGFGVPGEGQCRTEEAEEDDRAPATPGGFRQR